MRFLTGPSNRANQFQNGWGLGQATLHSSLGLAMGLLAVGFFVLSFTRPGFRELGTVAITLPLVWLASLVVRVSAQHLAIGSLSLDMQTLIGPTGNLSTDYEYFPRRQIVAYAGAGQLATACLAGLGLIVIVAIEPVNLEELPLSTLLDFKSGWGSEAWATQIMWVNVFLLILHCIPTIPFDGRAALYALLSRPSDVPENVRVMRSIAVLDSHLAVFLIGIASALAAASMVFEREVIGWYAAAALGVYLWMAHRWELTRAAEFHFHNPTISRYDAAHAVGNKRSSYREWHPTDDDDALSNIVDEASQPGDSTLDDITAAEEPASDFDDELLAGQSSSEEADGGATRRKFTSGLPQGGSAAEVDEILRKLHRHGRSSLTSEEQATLLRASSELNERRRQSS